MQADQDHQRQQDFLLDEDQPEDEDTVQGIRQRLDHEGRQEEIHQQKPDATPVHRERYRHIYRSEEHKGEKDKSEPKSQKDE